LFKQVIFNSNSSVFLLTFIYVYLKLCALIDFNSKYGYSWLISLYYIDAIYSQLELTSCSRVPLSINLQWFESCIYVTGLHLDKFKHIHMHVVISCIQMVWSKGPSILSRLLNKTWHLFSTHAQTHLAYNQTSVYSEVAYIQVNLKYSNITNKYKIEMINKE